MVNGEFFFVEVKGCVKGGKYFVEDDVKVKVKVVVVVFFMF